MSTIPAVMAQVDAALVDIDNRIDWLHYLSPLDNDAMWQSFVDSGYKRAPKLRYPDVPDNYAQICEELKRLPIDKVEEPLVEVLLQEKQTELQLQLELVLKREQAGFTAVSTELFGGLQPTLSQSAKQILARVAAEEEQPLGAADDANCADVIEAAQREIEFYRLQAPDLNATAQTLEDLNSMMMVHHGHLKVASSVRLPRSRINALIAHEVGTHIVTRYNGSLQPLKQFEVGLAHYDALQEGLGTLAEYLAGFLPARRLRVIAARVVASDLALAHNDVGSITAELHEQFAVPLEDAFDIAVRACRGGGLTKDSVYLRGLRDLLAYLSIGEDLTFLHLGKFAIEQRQIVRELMEQGWVQPPRIIPRHLQSEACCKRLERVRNLSIDLLFQTEPEL